MMEETSEKTPSLEEALVEVVNEMTDELHLLNQMKEKEQKNKVVCRYIHPIWHRHDKP